MNKYYRYIAPALKLWRQRRPQAILSTLGITVGVAGLILVIAIGEGAERELQHAVGALGAGTLIVRNTAADGQPNRLTEQKAQALVRLGGDSVEQLIPVRTAQRRISAGDNSLDSAILIGTTRHYAQLYPGGLHSGRFLADSDIQSGSRVTVLGWQAGKTLFPRGQVIGQQVRISGDWYKVVGWLGNSARNMPQVESLGLEELGQIVYVPINSPVFRPWGTALDELIVRFSGEAQLMSALGVVQRIFDRQQAESAVEYVIPIALLRHKQRVQQLFQYLLLGIAGLMLLVGGVGMMNIMMFNVIARRSEIGLRRAIGATRSDILLQFTTESMVIAVIGGVAGILLGLLCALTIDAVTSWHMVFKMGAAAIGFAASLIIGGIFGSYPALQAAAVSPVQSLRNQ